MALARGGTQLEVFNNTGSTIDFRSIVQVLPMLKSLGGVGRHAYRIQQWAVGSDIGSLGMLAVVTTERDIPDGEYGSVALAGGIVNAKIDGNATNVSQFDVLVAVTGQVYFRKWGSPQMNQGASSVVYSASAASYNALTVSAGNMSGSTVILASAGAALSANFSQINQNFNTLRAEHNKLVDDINLALDVEFDKLREDAQTRLDGEFDKLVNSVDSMFEVMQTVRGIYVGTATLTLSTDTGDVLLLAGPLGGQGG